MVEYDPTGYGKAVRDDYDTLYPESGLPAGPAADMIAALAKDGRHDGFVEFGIGTGRLALAVQERGVPVAGIDASNDMIMRLRAKPGGDRPRITIGDYRNDGVPGNYAVAAIVFNGIFDPRGVDAQLDIFRNAARHLHPGGYFVVESWVLHDLQRNGEWSVVPRFVGEAHVEIQLARYDIATNSIERTLVHLLPGRTEFVSVKDTYAAPAELDVMAHVTGFDRVERHANWERAPFTSASATHVTVYRKRSPTRQSA